MTEPQPSSPKKLDQEATPKNTDEKLPFITNRLPIITLIGSTAPEYRELYSKINRELTLEGIVVLSVGVFKDDVPDIEQYREKLESIHLQKIAMANMIVLISEDAVGKHTLEELKYCAKIGRYVRPYTNPVDIWILAKVSQNLSDPMHFEWANAPWYKLLLLKVENEGLRQKKAQLESEYNQLNLGKARLGVP